MSTPASPFLDPRYRNRYSLREVGDWLARHVPAVEIGRAHYQYTRTRSRPELSEAEFELLVYLDLDFRERWLGWRHPYQREQRQREREQDRLFESCGVPAAFLGPREPRPWSEEDLPEREQRRLASLLGPRAAEPGNAGGAKNVHPGE